MKNWPAVAAGACLLALGAFKELGLGPQWQEAAALLVLYGVLLAALAAFAADGRSSAVTLWLVTVAVYDGLLLVPPPLPKSLVGMFTILGCAATLLYLSVDGDSLSELLDTPRRLLDNADLKPYRGALLALVPLWAAAVVLAKTGADAPAPVFARSVHPAPPDQSDFKGKGYVLAEIVNPYRKFEKEDPRKFEEAVADGKRVYYQNCFYCHGDHLDGRGPAAAALNPRPANFQDPGTIAMLPESFVFWRVAKGGPGMPGSGAPWNSAMPPWEKMLTEDEAWKAILWIYTYTGYTPRTFAPLEH